MFDNVGIFTFPFFITKVEHNYANKPTVGIFAFPFFITEVEHNFANKPTV